jgi:tRNA(Arg) A34 adenosine deaminase TadA
VNVSTQLKIDIPAWLTDEVSTVPLTLPTPEDRMRVVNRLAERNHLEGTGGPFAALVTSAESGRLVAAGVNLVLDSGLSSAHAEVIAISLAQARVGHWDLSANGARFELVVNWRPCAMCYGALLWSGVRQLTIAGDGPELETFTGFDEGPLRSDWAQQLEQRGIAVRSGVLRDEALEVFRAYGARTDAVVYNARTENDEHTRPPAP